MLQGEIEDLFRFITFYISYGLVLVQLCLLLVPDLKSLNYRNRSLSEEEEPLLGNVSGTRQETDIQKVRSWIVLKTGGLPKAIV